MEIKIRYCLLWNYKPRAARLADELNNAFDVKAKLMPGWIGTFDVIVDGRLVFSKSKAGRLPASGEVISLVKRLQDGPADSNSWIWKVLNINRSM